MYYGDEAGLEGYRDPFNRGCFPWGQEDQDLLSWYRQLGKLRAAHKDVLAKGVYRTVKADWQPAGLRAVCPDQDHPGQPAAGGQPQPPPPEHLGLRPGPGRGPAPLGRAHPRRQPAAPLRLRAVPGPPGIEAQNPPAPQDEGEQSGQPAPVPRRRPWTRCWQRKIPWSRKTCPKTKTQEQSPFPRRERAFLPQREWKTKPRPLPQNEGEQTSQPAPVPQEETLDQVLAEEDPLEPEDLPQD